MQELKSTHECNNNSIPSWLLEKNQDGNNIHKVSNTGFIAKTLYHFSQVFENEFFCERYAAKPMILQCLDTRVKVIVLFAFMIFSAFCSSIAVLAVLAGIALLYAKLSGLDMKDYIRRVWAYIPVIVFILSLPGASSLFTKGEPLFFIVKPGLYFTAAGIKMAIRLALRPGISLSFAFLLLLTTKWTHITGALAAMRIPTVIISVLNMTYRYIFILVQLADNMLEARFSRTVGRLTAKENRKFLGRSGAYLFIKSQFLSEEIYDAMVCRGFTGKQTYINDFKITFSDILFAVNNAIIMIILIAGEHLF